MKKFVLIAFAGIVLFGCDSEELDFDNIQVPDFEGTYVFPLGEAKYTMRDLIASIGDTELDLVEDSTSFLTLFYRDTISYSGNDLVQIDDIEDGGTIPAPIFTGADDSTFTSSFSLPYDAQNGEQLDSLFYSSGNLEITVSSTTIGDLSYTLTFQNTVNNNGSPVVFNGNISGIGTDSQTQPLANHVTRLNDASGSNDFTVDFDGTITLAAGQTTTGTEEVRFDFAYRNQTFQTIFGKFGQDTIQVSSQAIDFEFFREMGEEGIFFGNPIMRFDFKNSFGLPIGVDLSGLYGSDGMGGTRTFLTGDIVDNPPIIEASEITNIGSIKESSFEVNNGNSSLVDLFATSPGRLVFGINGFTNPNDNSSTEENYLQPTSQIDAFIEMEIPMEIRLEDLEQSGTLSLGGGLNISSLDSAFMRIHTLNELPFSGILELEVQDADSNALYTVTDNTVIKAPFVNQGLVTDPSGVTADIPFSSEGLEALKTGSHVLFTVKLNTPPSQTSREIFVKLLADYSLEIKIGIGGKLRIDL